MKLEEPIQARYTPERVKEMASAGHPALSRIKRMENFGGSSLVLFNPKAHCQMVLRRARDYERVIFSGDGPLASIFTKLDEAIFRLGDRMEKCLTTSSRESRTFLGTHASEGLCRPDWGDDSTLYSLGPAPQLLNCDGLVVLRVRDETVDTSYVDRFEVRFGYWANTGPTQVAPPRDSDSQVPREVVLPDIRKKTG